jgi:GR25 family glycosyltransferase involved in LPS biosynthesis
MFKEYNLFKEYKLLIFLILILLILIIISNKSKFNNISGLCNIIKVDKCFLLSLPESKDRRDDFLKSYENLNLDIPLEIIYGINTKIKENAEKYKNLVNLEKFNNMYDYDNGEKRPDHTYFNSGALGCYLGHMEFYKHCFEQNLNYAIIFEDNIILDNNFKDQINIALSRLGDNFDVCFFHCWTHLGDEILKCGVKIKKIKWITSTKCYLINVNRMKKYYSLFYPINNHIDQIYEKLIDHGADIYLININSIKIQHDKKSTINHANVKNENKFQYLDKSEHKKIIFC